MLTADDYPDDDPFNDVCAFCGSYRYHHGGCDCERQFRDDQYTNQDTYLWDTVVPIPEDQQEDSDENL